MYTYEILDSEEVANRLQINNVPEEVHVTDMAHRAIGVKFDDKEQIHCWSYDAFQKLVSGGAISLTHYGKST